MLNFNCQRCGECCRRYFIISLPSEIEGQASFLGISEGDFIRSRMQLFLQLFPSEYREDKPVISSSLVPARFLEKIERHSGKAPEFFIALPMLVFRRGENGECTFYDAENSGCTIYQHRPVECRMFPFISDKKTENYAELYPFCHGLREKDAEKSYVDLSYIHFRQVAKYFSEVQEKGFSKIWVQWPRSGVVLYTDKLLGEISEKEFFGTIAPFS